MRTATQHLVKRYFFRLVPVSCMKMNFKSDQFTFSVHRTLIWPIQNGNSQFPAEKIHKFKFRSSR